MVVDLRITGHVVKSYVEFWGALSRRHRWLVAAAAAHREYPPPILWLERTEHHRWKIDNQCGQSGLVPQIFPLWPLQCSTGAEFDPCTWTTWKRAVRSAAAMPRKTSFLAMAWTRAMVVRRWRIWPASECYEYNGVGIKSCGDFENYRLQYFRRIN